MYYFLTSSENSTSSQEQEAESSAECFSDIPAFALSRSNSSAGASCFNGSGMESCHASQSGTTSGLSMDDRGEGRSMEFAEDSRVRTLALPTPLIRPELTESEAGYGSTLPESLAKWDQATSSWRTPQLLLFGALEQYSGTWPDWGLMLDGECWAQSTPAWIIKENVSGLLPTPQKLDGRGYYVATKRQAEGRITGDHQMHWIHVALLCGELSKAWANPQFSEALMGWPIKWTALEPLGTARFQQWCASHGMSFQPLAEVSEQKSEYEH
jgi:hypothetical protein